MIFSDKAPYVKIYAQRLVKYKVLERLARGIYILRDSGFDSAAVAVRIYSPSYVSFHTALSRYGIINQGTYSVTLATTRRNKKMVVGGIELVYHHLGTRFFWGYVNYSGVMIAEPEKALIDILYLVVLGKTTLSKT